MVVEAIDGLGGLDIIISNAVSIVIPSIVESKASILPVTETLLSNLLSMAPAFSCQLSVGVLVFAIREMHHHFNILPT